MKSYSVTIQMKPRPQYFHMVLFVFQHFKKENWEVFWNFYFEHLTNDFSSFLPRLAL